MPRLILTAALLLAACESPPQAPGDPRIDSLDELTVERLRERRYGSSVEVETERRHNEHPAFMASYRSDGLRVYTRIDLPATPAPAAGYPVVIFLHGWVGIDAAPQLDFYFSDDSQYAEIIDAHVNAGFAVFTPGWRGHGEVNGMAADGIDYLRAFDNGSYLSPVFYAIDVLNLLDGLASFDRAPLDPGRVNLWAHSQGGDVALIALAVAGEGSKVDTAIHAASIWSGTFAARFTQLETYWPMQTAPEAFLSGDGSWNGTATGANGRVNGRFVFGYPADWIETVEPDEWTWQKDVWNVPSVPHAIAVKLDQMYAAINTFVADIDDAGYTLAVGDSDAFSIDHDARVKAAMDRIGAFHLPGFLAEPLLLQHSDRDFYSFPEWNADLCRRINAADGNCRAFEYPQNTHSLTKSPHRWFSSADAVAGFAFAVQRDIALFSGRSPERIDTP